MRTIILIGLSLTLLASGCSSTGTSPQASTAPAPVATASAENQLAGRWTGQTQQGGSIVVNIPPSGMASYNFRGQNVPVRSSRMSGNAMVLTVGAGGGRVTLTPGSDGTLAYGYVYQGQTAAATLRRS